MPQALQGIDRRLFSALVLQGFTATQVANKLKMNVGTARSWIVRMGLVAVKGRVKAALATVDKQDLAVQVAKHASARVRDRIGDALERDAEWLKDAPAVRNAKEMKKRYESILPAVSIAGKVFDWDREAGSGHINLTSITIAPDPQEQPVQVIEDKAESPSNQAE